MNIVVVEPLGIKNYEEALKPLKDKGHTVTYYEERTENQENLISRCENAEIIIVANLPLKENVLSQCKKLKMISVAFTGFDHIDIEYCKTNKITVCNAAGYSTHAVAELTFGFIISVLRNLIPCNAVCKEGKTKAGLVGNQLFGKTLGVIGTGEIGSKVSALGVAFGCKVIAYSRTEKDSVKAMGVTYKSLEDVMKESDIVSLHLPLNSQTNKLINKDNLLLMKENAIIINTARGGIIDSQHLADALNSDKISGAGIDVFETEPPLNTNHPLLNSKNTIVAPHVGFATHESLFVRAQIVVSNILGYENNNLQNLVV